MSAAACILGQSPVRLWGLTSTTRLARQLAQLNITLLDQQEAVRGEHDIVMLLRAEFLFELRTLRALLQQPGAVLHDKTGAIVAAAAAPGGQVAEYLDAIGNPARPWPPSAQHTQVTDLDAFDYDLRRSDAPLLEQLREDNHDQLESCLYGNAYKGITDLVTKWWWPQPARVLVKWCTELGISPNQVTLAGVLLVVLVCILFALGWFVTGLICAWLMTLLDTVDGKLARVTVQSSRLGHILDHGTDIIHPPFWYIFWLHGLDPATMPGGFSVDVLMWAIVIGYIGGRAIEGAFELMAKCSMFAWRPLDAYFRLVVARRNPCLIIMSSALVVANAEWAIAGVAGWTVLCTILLLLRLVYALVLRLGGTSLTSWLADPIAAARDFPRAYRMFSSTRRAYE